MDTTVENFIITHSGHGYVYEHPDPDCVLLEDIAHALSNICRYTGHVNQFYSVAEHCVRVSWAVEKKYGPQFALEGLLHDAAEAYVTDVNKPLKMLLGEPYKRLEAIAMNTIAAKFGIPVEKSKQVAYCDGSLYLAERRDLFGENKPSFTLTHHIEKKADEMVIKPWAPRFAEMRFLSRYDEVKL